MERTKNNKPTILACDPSFTAWGLAVIQNHTVIDHGCIRTVPEAKKRRIREGDDRVRRASELINGIVRVINTHHIEFIVSELPHGSQNAKAAVMIGAVAGIMQTISICLGIPIEWYSENDAKKALLGRLSATKAEVIEEVEKVLEIEIPGHKYYREAVADALAIYNVAQITSPTLKILTR